MQIYAFFVILRIFADLLVIINLQCYCPPRFYGNPRVRCERPQCVTDEECPQHLACENEKCVSPCKCPPSAICNVFNHRPGSYLYLDNYIEYWFSPFHSYLVCTCPPGQTGSPTVRCSPSKLSYSLYIDIFIVYYCVWLFKICTNIFYSSNPNRSQIRV